MTHTYCRMTHTYYRDTSTWREGASMAHTYCRDTSTWHEDTRMAHTPVHRFHLGSPDPHYKLVTTRHTLLLYTGTHLPYNSSGKLG